MVATPTVARARGDGEERLAQRNSDRKPIGPGKSNE